MRHRELERLRKAEQEAREKQELEKRLASRKNPIPRGDLAGEVAAYASPLVRSHVGVIRESLTNQRDKLLQELDKVEKALHLINGDSRVRELDDLLIQLGI